MQNNFSYPLKLEDMSSKGQHFTIDATEGELRFIADVLKVPQVKSFHAEMDVIYNKPSHQVRVSGHLKALVEQISVISLKKFNHPYKVEFSRLYDTQMTLAQQRELEDFDDINAEIPDVMENSSLDLKAISLEALALELDDFPRQKGEQFDYTPDFDPSNDKPENPFAVLKYLKK